MPSLISLCLGGPSIGGGAKSKMRLMFFFVCFVFQIEYFNVPDVRFDLGTAAY